MRQYFVTGTDTGVGKTFVGTALVRLARARGQQVFAFKPIETGCTLVDGHWVGEDQTALVAAAGGWQDGELGGVYQFQLPAAPFVAARKEGTEIDLERIVRVYRDGLRRLLGAPPEPVEEATPSFDLAGDTILGIGPYEAPPRTDGPGAFRSPEAGASGSFRVPDARRARADSVGGEARRAHSDSVGGAAKDASAGIAVGRTRTTDRVRLADLGIADGLSGRRRSREFPVPVRLTTPAQGILATDPLYEHYIDGTEFADPNQPNPNPAVAPGLCLIEGAGGWRVPITRTVGMSGLARRIGAPVIIVARGTLGTLNHSMLTVEAVERDGLRVAALVLSTKPGDDLEAATSNAAELRRTWKGQVIELWNDPTPLSSLLD